MTNSPPPPVPTCMNCYKEIPGNKDMYPACYECYYEKPNVKFIIDKLTFEEIIKRAESL
tara:strand:+ start:200 stop:376 length:177 start_codon:yes stop_codon:yes gene_type:complete